MHNIIMGCAARDNGGPPERLAAASSGVGSPSRWLPVSHSPTGSLPAALYGYWSPSASSRSFVVARSIYCLRRMVKPGDMICLHGVTKALLEK
jgi:hypothetical protein